MREAMLGKPAPSNEPFERILRVNDQEVRLKLTHDQETVLLQKGLAADDKFREASEMRKEAEQGIRLQHDLEQIIQAGDVDAFRRMGAAMGIPAPDVEEAAQKVWGDGSEDEEWEDRSQRPSNRVNLSTPKARNSKTQVDFDSLDAPTKRLLVRAEKQRIDEIIGLGLDTSEIIRYNMKEYDEDGKKAIRELVEDKVRGRLPAFGGDFGDGSAILPGIIKDVEATLKALGSQRRSISPLSMGSSPGGGDLGVYPTKKPDHVSSQDAGFESHIAEQLAFNMAQAQRAER